MRNESIQALVDYAERTGLIESADRVWAVNRLLEVLHADTYTPPKQAASGSLADILRDLCDCALETGALEQDSVVYRDLFDTKLMGALTPMPSQVQTKTPSAQPIGSINSRRIQIISAETVLQKTSNGLLRPNTAIWTLPSICPNRKKTRRRLRQPN